ncbi:MAG TPA: DnaB-like helicase C-terminal domain-containing protein, partial [Herpetosiphonaceae bacterium]|nr:DnaB-like helicase C-terminal domain-containing protein [Herpetosiphonaceae bacterium]
AVHVEYYGQIVERTDTLRRIISAGTQIVNIGYNELLDTAEALDAAQRAIHEVAQGRGTRDFVSIAEVLEAYFDKLDFIQQHRGEIVGVPTGFQDLDQLTGGLQKSDLVIMAARPGVGKCVAADTPMVDPETGALLTAADLYRRGQAGQEVTVFSLTEAGKLTTAEPSAYVDDGIKSVYRVRTQLGREIKTTLAHPFLTPNGWVPLSELTVGTRVAVPRALPVFGNESLPEAEIVLLAYLIGDGTLTRCTPMVTTVSETVVEDLHRQARALGLRVTVSPCPNRAPSYRIAGKRRRANPLTELLKGHGLWNKRAQDKHIPSAIFRLPKEQLTLFLNRLFATDGTAYISKSGGNKTVARVSYCSTSKRLAQEVQHLLLRFGINANLRERQVRYQGATRLAYEVDLLSAWDVCRFAAQIGIYGKEEAVARVAAHAMARNLDCPRDTLPVQLWEQITAAKGDRSWASVSRSAGKPSTHNWHVAKRAPRRDTVRVLARTLDAPALALHAEADIFWDTITAITYVGEEQVYDLTVPTMHNFVAADIYVHNTSFSLGLAYNAAMAGKTVAIFNLEMPAEQLVQRLLAMETGIDSHRLRLGHIDDDEWERISAAFGKLSEAKIYIDDTPGIGIMELRSKARRLQAERGLDFVQVDYLQLMQGTRRGDNRVQEVSEISRGLKGLARELNVPVLALAQLSRSVETRSSHIPMLSDLRESGCLT